MHNYRRFFWWTARKVLGACLCLCGLSINYFWPKTSGENMYGRCDSLLEFAFWSSLFRPKTRKKWKRRSNNGGGGGMICFFFFFFWRHVRGLPRIFCHALMPQQTSCIWPRTIVIQQWHRARSDWSCISHVHAWTAIPMWSAPVTRGKWNSELTETFFNGGLTCTVAKFTAVHDSLFFLFFFCCCSFFCFYNTLNPCTVNSPDVILCDWLGSKHLLTCIVSSSYHFDL